MEQKEVRRDDVAHRWEVMTPAGWQPLPWDSTTPFEFVQRYLQTQAGKFIPVRWRRAEDVRRIGV